jgi:MinD superfamily P-loop ATPase
MKCFEKEGVDETFEMAKFIWNEQRAETCPFDGLTVFQEAAYHCDLCHGEPQCVSVCTNEAITIEP